MEPSALDTQCVASVHPLPPADGSLRRAAPALMDRDLQMQIRGHRRPPALPNVIYAPLCYACVPDFHAT